MKDCHKYIYEKFPETLFSPVDAVEYCKTLSVGFNKAKHSNVAITGICRNISDVLEQSVARLYKTASLFNEYCFVIYENDSNDGTSERLKSFSEKDDRFILIQETHNRAQYGNTRDYDRAVYLSELRNHCLDIVKDVGHVDYVVVVDLDLAGGWSYDGILNSLAYEGWSAMTSNGILYREKRVSVTKDNEPENVSTSIEPIFFDTWAFRKYGEQYPHKDEDLHSMSFMRGEEPVEVFSNFGGLAIYKHDAIANCRYGAQRHDNGSVSCDHPFIHEQMRDAGGRIFLNPSMIALHSPHEFSAQI